MNLGDCYSAISFLYFPIQFVFTFFLFALRNKLVIPSILFRFAAGGVCNKLAYDDRCVLCAKVLLVKFPNVTIMVFVINNRAYLGAFICIFNR